MKTPEGSEAQVQALQSVDRIVHEPARLAVLTYLSLVESADFVFLMRTTGLTWGNLSSHLARLEEVGYVAIEKEFVQKKPHTMARLTQAGRDALAKYRTTMQTALGGLSEQSRPAGSRRPESSSRSVSNGLRGLRAP